MKRVIDIPDEDYEFIKDLQFVVFRGGFKTIQQHVINAIKNSKPYKPDEEINDKSEGIPVSEELPDDRDWYLGFFREPDTGFIGLPYICSYVGEVTKGTTNEGWILRHCTDVDTVPDYFRNLIFVARQPLPEPYKKGDLE